MQQAMQPTQEGYRGLEIALIESLLHGHVMNDFLRRFLQVISSAFSVEHAALFDYDEISKTFDLLYFHGYHDRARSGLRERLHRMDMKPALEQREPYWSDDSHLHLLIPLYFQKTLEAVLLLESGSPPLHLDATRLSSCRLVSRFLGLFMSSNRLPVNQRPELTSLSDLERAREIQLSYLPSEHPTTDRYEIFGYNQSSALVGGDYFDYFRQKENSIQCVIADACGHGMAAALIMSSFRGSLHSEVLRVHQLSSLYTGLNQQLYSSGELVQYLTSVFFEYREEEEEIRYLNAGHFEPLIVHPNGALEQLPGGGPPLGMFRDSAYEASAVRVQAGDILVLFTDGLTELTNAKEEFLGVEGIQRAVVELRHLPLRELAKGVLNKAAQFSHKAQPDDDLTLFLMRFR